VLDRPMVDEPGVKWTYNGGCTALLGRLIAKGTGDKLPDYARRVLFDPMGFGPTEWSNGLKGEAAANAFLKCITKAKRRVTLSISGLGFSDETEMDDIPGAEPQSFAHIAAKPEEPPAADKVQSSGDDYSALWEVLMKEATSAEHLAMRWNAERSLRNNIEWRGAEHANLKAAVTRRIEELKLNATAADLATQRLNAGDA